MPKMKTTSGVKKRFKVTGTGKLRYKKANRGHLMRRKNSKRARRLERPGTVSDADAPRVRKMLGI